MSTFTSLSFAAALSLGLSLGTSVTAFAQNGTPEPTLQKHAPAEPPAMQPAPHASDVKGSITMPTVTITSPKDGDTVKSKFDVKFAVSGMKLSKAGSETAGSGHFILIVDGAAVEKGQAVPKDKQHIHLDKAQKQTSLTLPAGAHTLTVQFADGQHSSYGEVMSQTIKVTVK